MLQPNSQAARCTAEITRILIFSLISSLLACSANSQDFNRDVRQILATHCFACHGPDASHRESDLRFDERNNPIESSAIVPGDPSSSGMIERITSGDQDHVMPPPEFGNSLNSAQIEILKKWIAGGAKYERHWAFVAPSRTEAPKSRSSFVANQIDEFVFKKLQDANLNPNAAADRYTLLRRLYLDLVGLPPTIEETDTFLNSKDPEAYRKVVDQLLGSPRFGEKWAQFWLDLARYSDTNGYEKDRPRAIWPYRDWVIRAFNNDMPFDKFTIDQIAGDMLPSPKTDQLVATGFHRNTMLNEEGGIDPLEFRYLAMVDRVATTGTVWLGLTVGCAQCHTHKYDPISHTDYYRFLALLNNADEPDLRIPSEKSGEDKVNSEIKALESELLMKLSQRLESQPAKFGKEWQTWIESSQSSAINWAIATPTELSSNLPFLKTLDDSSIFSTGDTTKRDEFFISFQLDGTPITGIRLEALPDERLPGMGPGRTYYEGRKGDFFVSEISVTLDGKPIDFNNASHDFSKPDDTKPKTTASNVFDGNGSTGWSPGNNKAERLKLVINPTSPINGKGKLTVRLLFERHYTASLGRFRFSFTGEKAPSANRFDENLEEILTKSKSFPSSQYSMFQAELTSAEFKTVQLAFAESIKDLESNTKTLNKLKNTKPPQTETLIFREREARNPRRTFRHHRGEYLSPREEVTPGILSIFQNPEDEQSNPTNRLELAHWLVSDKNPLASRVAVNRIWYQIFGTGLMKTNADFGLQAEMPSHPELLDWLAFQFQNELKWSTKELIRYIVMSNTYRQASNFSVDKENADPENRLLSRGPSFRVSGEMVRDIALSATGVLSSKMYGPGVKPPQPAGVTELAWGSGKWSPSNGEDRYRRSIYTFKKRTAAFAAFTVFDAPTGEACIATRNRSNTPLQALTVLNDPMFIELNQKFAKNVIEQNFPTPAMAITYIFRRFLTRLPTEFESSELNQFYQTQLTRLQDGAIDSEAIGGKDATAEQAAFAMVSRIIMNLDETITKR